MAGMVFLTALACCVVFLFTITNQTREFESRLEQKTVALPAPAPPEEVVQKLQEVLAGSEPAQTRLNQAQQILMDNPQAINADQILQIAADSGWPVSSAPARVIMYSRLPASPDQSQPGDQFRGIDTSDQMFIRQTSLLDNPMYGSILIASLVSVLFAVGLGLLLSRTVIRPLHALEKASEKIADGNYTLELKPEGKDDLGRLAASFNKMSRALRQTEQKRRDLLADLSHELRTPLSGIQGYTEALRYGLVQDERRQNEIYDHILSEVKYLSGMVNVMREWTKAEQMLDCVRLENIEVEPIARNVLERFTPAAQKNQVTLQLELAKPQVQVYADAESLNHILNNLVDNALRYTPSGGRVEIRITPCLKENLIRFEVCDSGCGIPAEHLPFVFERFYRVDKSRDRATGGSGLGLAIVRDAVQALGGDIKLESEVGTGTQVIFYLPGSRLAANANIE
jgi:signal transduction histidine kinase